MNAEKVIGLDGLALIIHPDNPVNALDTEQIAQIFSGKITHWNQLGGGQGSIRLYARDGNSRTWETFRDLVLPPPRRLELHTDARRFETHADLSQAVSSDINAMQIAPQAEMPASYQQLAEEAQRLLVNFRFKEGSSQLDNKAWQNIDRVRDYLQAQNKTENKVVLVGFGDPRHGGAELISKLRAMKVRRAWATMT